MQWHNSICLCFINLLCLFPTYIVIALVIVISHCGFCIIDITGMQTFDCDCDFDCVDQFVDCLWLLLQFNHKSFFTLHHRHSNSIGSLSIHWCFITLIPQSSSLWLSLPSLCGHRINNIRYANICLSFVVVHKSIDALFIWMSHHCFVLVLVLVLVLVYFFILFLFCFYAINIIISIDLIYPVHHLLVAQMYLCEQVCSDWCWLLQSLLTYHTRNHHSLLFIHITMFVMCLTLSISFILFSFSCK